MGEFIADKIFKKGPILGEAVCCIPDNQQTQLDATTNIGGCSGLYYSMTFQLPKWGYKMKKIDEWMDVSPVYAEAYNLTVEQKHKLEAQIKEGLRSAAQGVADFELLKHDYRKYREMLDFWKKGKKDDHILRSLFIDRVDVYVGENFSMVSLVKRWPTLISDFIRMPREVKEEDWENIDKIKDGLSVTKAEAHILMTKNILYKQWRDSFFVEVKDRFARIKTLTQARKASVDEYREWLKPYVARYKVMSESLERKPSGILSDPFMAPGFGNAWSASCIRFFAWQPYYPPEAGKPQRISTKIFDPVDKFTMKYVKEIEENYKVKLDQKKIRELHKGFLSRGEMVDSAIYYVLFDITATKSLVKIPKGGEIEDIVIDIKHWIISQNVLLVFLLELEAKGMEFDRYVNEIIGTKDIEASIREEVEKEFAGPEEKEENFASLKEAGKMLNNAVSKTLSALAPMKGYFIRPGPYESNFKERITKSFMLPMGAMYYGKLVKFLKWKMGVPGMPEEY